MLNFCIALLGSLLNSLFSSTRSKRRATAEHVSVFQWERFDGAPLSWYLENLFKTYVVVMSL